jgi:RNA polymerase sigma-70 factor, ECF subfamily
MEYRDEQYDLIRAGQAGDEKAIAELVQSHAEAVKSMLTRLCGNRHVAEDLAQDTFVRALLALKHYEFRAPFRAWLYRIAMNLYRDYRRRRMVRTIVSSYHDEKSGGENSIANPYPSDPLQDLERRERHAHLYQALASLPESLRRVIILRDIQELSYEEIAQTLHWRLGTIKSRLFRARKELADLLSDFWEES